MYRAAPAFVALGFGLCLLACGATDEGTQAPGSGGSSTSGGASSAGGYLATSGGAPTGGAAAGGTNTLGGSANGGSDSARGGSSGGALQAGGSSARGGAANGGAASGGRVGVGGTSATGGTSARGGASAAGGTNAGGASAGGSSALGGSAGAGGVTAPKKFVGNITTRDSVDTGGMKFSKYWDQITPENAGKWGSVQSSGGSAFNWRTLDTIYAYTQTNNIVFKHHCFVWGSQQPSGTPTLAQVENWIKSFCERYPNTKLIDVVNEPPPHTTPNYTANLGAGESGTYGWITKAFKLARKYCPNAVLIINDYNNIEYSSQESHFIDIVNQVKAAGGPIDAVGAQSHALKGMSASTLQANLDTLATKTGLPVYITEYDIGDANDQTQLSNFQAHFPVFLNTAAIHGITVWGWINGSTWVANTGLMNGTTPRASMKWLMGQLARPVAPN